MKGLPPIGIKPRWLWEYIRIQELKDAIQRYKNAGIKPLKEWEEELKELEERQTKR